MLRRTPFVNAPHLYVANSALDSVTVYAADANGVVAPVREIVGTNTGLDQPTGVGVDSRGALYVANKFGPGLGSITVYAPGATGNALPIREIIGNNTLLFFPGALALDARDNLYVANVRGVVVYAPGAGGNVAPIRSIAGPATGLGEPTGIAVDARGDLFVADARSDKPGVKTYAPGANGNVGPIRTLEGAGTGLLSPRGVAVDGRGELFVTNSGYTANYYVTVYAAGANRNTSPIRAIVGASTELNGPIGTTLDASGDLFVANAGASSVTVYASGASGNVRPVHEIRDRYFLNHPSGVVVDGHGYLLTTNVADDSLRIFAPGATGNPTPIRSIAGSNTQLKAPVAAVADAARNIYVLNSTSVTEYASGVFGNVAPIRVIAGSNTSLGVYPRALTRDAGGNLVVTSSSGNAIVVFAAGASGNVRPIRTIAGSNTSLQDPLGVAFDGNGSLYVENADTVTVYAAGASGNATPIRALYAPELVYAAAMAVDRSGSIITCSDSGPPMVTVYAPGASGFDNAVRIISGPHTGLAAQCGGVAVDSSGSIFVTNNSDAVAPDSVTVYAAGAMGDAAPVRSLANSSITKLRSPAYLTFGL